jgi:zinc D-Ala-D-Ala dipeptidase
MHMKMLWAVIFFFSFDAAFAQASFLAQEQPIIIKDISVYKKSVLGKPGFEMVDVKSIKPGIELDLRYATPNNFLHKKIYPAIATTYLRKNAAFALASVQKELKQKGLGLKIFDAYRPHSISKKIWALVKDERYAANPLKGSNHNRGVAVDVTIINLKTKAALSMGTGFDNFSDTAHHNFISLPDSVLQNRLLLKQTMEKNGFESFETEWWHYTLPKAKEYELMDLSFDELKKLRGK